MLRYSFTIDNKRLGKKFVMRVKFKDSSQYERLKQGICKMVRTKAHKEFGWNVLHTSPVYIHKLHD